MQSLSADLLQSLPTVDYISQIHLCQRTGDTLIYLIRERYMQKNPTANPKLERYNTPGYRLKINGTDVLHGENQGTVFHLSVLGLQCYIELSPRTDDTGEIRYCSETGEITVRTYSNNLHNVLLEIGFY